MAGTTGTVTIVETNTWGVVKQITFSWVTGSSGQADEAPATQTPGSYNGKILACVTSPSTSAQPDDNYDITLTDSNDWDVLRGAGLNRDEATTEFIYNGSTGAASYRFLPMAWERLTLNVTNAGTETAGVVTIFIGV